MQVAALRRERRGTDKDTLEPIQGQQQSVSQWEAGENAPPPQPRLKPPSRATVERLIRWLEKER